MPGPCFTRKSSAKHRLRTAAAQPPAFRRGDTIFPLLLGANTNIVRTAQAVAPRILFADCTPPRDLASLLRGGRDHFFTLDYSDDRAVEEFASVLVDDLSPDVVLPVTESGLLPAARLTSLLGLPDTPIEMVRQTLEDLDRALELLLTGGIASSKDGSA